MRELLAEEKENNDRRAHLAIEVFCYRVRKYIGSYLASIGGADAVIFTGGIGENSPEIRRRVCEASAWLGIDFDTEANEQKATKISRPASKISVWVIPTNEEQMIAFHTGELLGLRSQAAEQTA
jgi:acetate kinase